MIDKIEGRRRDRTLTGMFNAKDAMLLLSYGLRLTSNLTTGFNLKFINQRISDYSGYAAGIDGGILYNTEKFNAGFSIQNIGTKMKLKSEGFSLPVQARLGGGIKLFDNTITLGVDILKPLDNNFTISSGVEVSPFKFLNFRLGYRYNIQGTNSNNFKAYTAGIGFNIKGMQLDYAFVPTDDFGVTHRVGLMYNMEVTKDEGRRDDRFAGTRDEGTTASLGRRNGCRHFIYMIFLFMIFLRQTISFMLTILYH